MIPEPKLDALVARHQAVERELASPVTPETYVKLSREFAELAPIVETVKDYRAVVAEIAGLDALIADAATDAEMRRRLRAEAHEVIVNVADVAAVGEELQPALELIGEIHVHRGPLFLVQVGIGRFALDG